MSRSTDKETEMCLCSKCLNPHCLYKASKTNVNTDLPKSLSDDLCKNFKCDHEPETNFFHRDCTLGKCQNKCEILSTSADLKDQRLDEDKKVVSFYVFETVKTKYFNKLGKEVSYDRNACVDKKDLIQNIISQLQSVAVHYLIYRFLIINDFTYWRRFLSETEHYTLWLDYFQTTNFTEKRQVQSAHFSGRQHTLHNTVLQAPKNGKHIFTTCQMTQTMTAL